MRSLTFTKHNELVALASGDVAHKRQQVIRHTLRVLAHKTAGVSTTGVKVAQKGAVPDLNGSALLLGLVALRLDVVGDNILDDGLGTTVGVCGANGAVLRDRDHVGEASGIAVNSGGGREDNVVDVVALHGAKEGDGTANIDAVVLERDLTRLANSL